MTSDRAQLGARLTSHPSRGYVNGFWWVAGIGMVLVDGAFLPWRFWEELHDDQDSLSTTIRNLGLVIGGIIAMLLAVWRSLVAESQAYTARQGLLNERYRQATEMLGSTVLSVRLGGIYALQRLAEEHPREYHVQVERIFCAFVRHPAEVDTRTTDLTAYGTREAIGSKEFNARMGLRPDVRAAMEAIAARSETEIILEQEKDYRPDLSGAQLLGLSLYNANLSGVGFEGADLRGAYFLDMDLSGTALTHSNLSGANISFSKLSGTRLRFANLSSANIGSSDLSDAALHGANLSNAELFDSDLSGAKLNSADFSGADLSRNGEAPVKGLTQSQLNNAKARENNLPKLAGVQDAETGKPLVWKGEQHYDTM